MYKKRAGFINFKVVGFTPFWVDGIQAKTNAKITIFFKHKISEKLKENLARLAESGFNICYLVSKGTEPDFYNFKGFAGGRQFGVSTKTKNKISAQHFLDDCAKDLNPARGRGRTQLLTGREGLRNFDRTNNGIIENAIANAPIRDYTQDLQRIADMEAEAYGFPVKKKRKSRKY